MITFLVDHNIEGQALLLQGALLADGWLDLLALRFVTFTDVGLPFDSSDRVVWRFAQAQAMILLTANRKMIGANSLEQTIREENNEASLPVLTIATVDRLKERAYREQCVTRLVEIVFDLDNYLGTARLFIP